MLRQNAQEVGADTDKRLPAELKATLKDGGCNVDSPIVHDRNEQRAVWADMSCIL